MQVHVVDSAIAWLLSRVAASGCRSARHDIWLRRMSPHDGAITVHEVPRGSTRLSGGALGKLTRELSVVRLP